MDPLPSFDALAARALHPRHTDDLFLEHHRLFVEISARWISEESNDAAKITAFGRIVPFSPHLAEHAEAVLQRACFAKLVEGILASQAGESPSGDDCDALGELLLSIFRLLSFDIGLAKFATAAPWSDLFHHPSKAVRYLAVRVFALVLGAADSATQQLAQMHVHQEQQEQGDIRGSWEGKTIDYRFLSLWEETRYATMNSKLEKASSDCADILSQQLTGDLSPCTLNMQGVLLPRLHGPPSQRPPFEMHPSPTMELSLGKIAEALLSSSPLLLTGLPGCGKTLLARHAAWQLNKLDTMVTLHLNEQSDAKLLVGLYTTGHTPGTFSWQPGVLTTAVREGRWILIEDLDSAPNEVISTLLPLIEHGEMLIPSRGEIVRAARGFRIIATMRSALGSKGHEIMPRRNLIGLRFWNRVAVNMPDLPEFARIAEAKHPSLEGHIPAIMRVYSRLESLFSEPRFVAQNGTSLRALTPRDLLKWCDRIAALLSHSANFTTAQLDDIFMEAKDCFAGSLRSEDSRLAVMAVVAEELHIDPQRRDHLLLSRDVRLEGPSKATAAGVVRIGRARLPRPKLPRRLLSARPFSTNGYTLRLLEKLAVAIDRKEPLLLVGETGTGKTTCIQYLAEQLGRKMTAVNLSQQSESSDLLGGYKPVNVRSLIIPMKDEFDELFDATFSRKANQPFVEKLGKRVADRAWRSVCTLWRAALKRLEAAGNAGALNTTVSDAEGGQPLKKRRIDALPANYPRARWDKFATDLRGLEAQLSKSSNAFAFSFLEGNIVKAVRNGDWVLLDEINLASPDTLEALADLLGGGPDGTPSILLTETGNVERVIAHPNFRIFAAMNPATDVGKKDLPPGIRSRFTEIYVASPDGDVKSLRSIVKQCLGGDSDDSALMKVSADVTDLYLEVQRLAKSNMLVDGAEQKAHFSLRTLVRTLSYARDMAVLCSLRRALYEGFHMSFLTFLGRASEDVVAPLIEKYLFADSVKMRAELGRPMKRPTDSHAYVQHGAHWLRQGRHPVAEQPHYIITPFVQRNLNNLIRAISTRRYPVLIQGPTSSGKTSMIEHLAKCSGNKFLRINNHEHTDLQEYMGSYVSDADGKFTFQEGVLVRALREGHWVVLDELNLAPTDVLEALNRLLDDNRELLIPETQEVVRPHEDFMLFATQNPAGLYGGRKVLSRAFRNRFLELHFDDIPVEELTEILHKRTLIPESWCKRIVRVYEELSTLRQENRLFEQKSFATLRDLFRWALRKADTVQDLANNGYMLLAERVRKEDERQAVKRVIETVMSKRGPQVLIDAEAVFSDVSLSEMQLCPEAAAQGAGIVWTRAMRRLFTLVANAVRNNEPVLLVGETGCGKTSVCQLLAAALGRQLYTVNAHQNTETGDLIGAQRPVRNRAAIEEHLRKRLLSVLATSQGDSRVAAADLPSLLELYDGLNASARDSIPAEHQAEIYSNRIKAAALFEWADGSLVHAMTAGQCFLLDEISLADDSVLERLNSVLEPQRTLLLAEKGSIDSVISASEGFQFFATMNPGGDYGKRELSPALRNRFTEIWVPALSDVADVLQIVEAKLGPELSRYAGSIVSFAQWFNDKYNNSVASSISIRDTLKWVSFAKTYQTIDSVFGIVHGAAMVFLDTLGANPAGLLAISPAHVEDERKACLGHLGHVLGVDVLPIYYCNATVTASDTSLQFGPFSMPRCSDPIDDSTFSMDAPTTQVNAMRIARALQVSKSILLEGNPGVGKSTLVAAIARTVGKPLARLNLSEQTDLMDLFGSDIPVEGSQTGVFAWRDAPFLKAMKRGEWVLLDEMNLASQSVLEGLNAVLDHRGEVYVSELDQSFRKHPDFCVFAAQNPHHQGGGRKGLPASFVNRFTVVYADVFQSEDLEVICKRGFPDMQLDQIGKLISFVAGLDDHVVNRRSFGALGGPWEFNLRDTLRWLQLLRSSSLDGTARDFLDTVFLQRFRTAADRSRVLELFAESYGSHSPRRSLYNNMSANLVQVGLGLVYRDRHVSGHQSTQLLHTSHLGAMEALMISVQQNWPVILVGPSGAGKTFLISQLAAWTGASIASFSMNPDVDSMDLVGGFEQFDSSRGMHQYLERLERFARQRSLEVRNSKVWSGYLRLLDALVNARSHDDLRALLEDIASRDPSSETASFLDEVIRLMSARAETETARFQWVDGLLVRALQKGQWLVLDNANLCSSSVLDRLNSLLEPHGYLSINEHATEDGEATVVRPHPNFRIFLTMDPRFGELSRAMRNRAVEICLFGSENDANANERRLPSYPLDSTMYRFRHFLHQSQRCVPDFAFDHLSTADQPSIGSFCAQVARGLLCGAKSTQGVEAESEIHLWSCSSRRAASSSLGMFTICNEFFTTRDLDVWQVKDSRREEKHMELAVRSTSESHASLTC